MIYPAVAVVLALIAAVIVLLGLRLLFNRHWLLGWLRGMFGLAIVAVAVILALAAWDLRSYRQVLAEQPVATLTFNKLESQRYGVTLVFPDSREQRLELSGDLWQLDARILKWSTALAGLGLKPGYRLDRISGRYLSLEDEQNRPRSVAELGTEKAILDAWYWLRQVNQRFTVLDAQYGSAAYLPMADGAMFTVNIGPSGLVAKPLNDRAKLAAERWE
ncbi:MAG: cation/multidrug efflux pump [Spongiibacteraceae bacterium]